MSELAKTSTGMGWFSWWMLFPCHRKIQICPKLHLKENKQLAKERFRHINSCKRPIRKETISRTGGVTESTLWCTNHTQKYTCVFAFVMDNVPFLSKALKSLTKSLSLFVCIYLPICPWLHPGSAVRFSKDNQEKVIKYQSLWIRLSVQYYYHWSDTWNLLSLNKEWLWTVWTLCFIRKEQPVYQNDCEG